MAESSLLSLILSFKKEIQIIEHNVATLDAGDVYLYDYVKLYAEELAKIQHSVDELQVNVRRGKFPTEMGMAYIVGRRFTLKHLQEAAVLLDESELYDYPFLVDHGKKIDLPGFSLATAINEMDAAAYGTPEEQRIFAQFQKYSKTLEIIEDPVEKVLEEDKFEQNIWQKVNALLQDDDDVSHQQNRYADLIMEIQEEEERILEFQHQQKLLQKEQKRQELQQKQQQKKKRASLRKSNDTQSKTARRNSNPQIESLTQQENKSDKNLSHQKERRTTSKQKKQLSPGEQYLKKLREERKLKKLGNKDAALLSNTLEVDTPAVPSHRITSKTDRPKHAKIVSKPQFEEERLLERTRNFRNFLLSKGIHPDVLHGIMMSFRNDMPSLMREHVDKDFTNMFDYSKVPVIETWIERIETIRSKNSTVPPRITFFSRWLRMYVEFLKL